MPVQEINVIDARHLDQPKPVPYCPPTVITVVRAGPEQRDGCLLYTSPSPRDS